MTARSRILGFVICVGILLTASAYAAPVLLKDRPAALRPQIMVLGTVHLANHNRDIQNPQMDDDLTPARQAQIAAMVNALAQWKPTRIAVEWRHRDQAGMDKRYQDYRMGRYTLGRDEIDQIGLRLAKQLNLAKVDAVDIKDDPPGPQSDYDLETGAKAAHEESRLAAITAPAYARKIETVIRGHSVAGFLRVLNKPDALADLNRLYYDIAMMGPAEANNGANWVGGWHARNLKILTNLVRLDAAPDERILVIFGVGHAYLLNQFAEDSHAFRLVRPDAWLARADGKP
jgi:hypothetical protein